MPTYFVTQAGGETIEGSTAISVATHNAATYSAADVIYLCGNIEDTVIPPSSGTAGVPIVYRGDISAYPGTLLGPNASSAAFDTGLATKRDYLKLQGLTFSRALTGIRATDGSSGWTVDDCVFSELAERGLLINSVDTDGRYLEYWKIVNSRFENVGAWGNTAASGINLVGRVRRNKFCNLSFTGNGSSRGVDGITFSQNTNAAHDGSGNYIYGISASGLEENGLDFKKTIPSAAGEGGTIIVGADISNCAAQLVNVAYGTTDLTFIGANFHDTASAGVNLTNQTGDEARLYFYGSLFLRIGGMAYNEAAATTGPVEFYNTTFSRSAATDTSNYHIQIGSSNMVAKNCAFYYPSASRTAATRYHIRFRSNANYSGATLDYNRYYPATPADKLIYDGTNTFTLAQLQAASKELNGAVQDMAIDDDGWLSTQSEESGLWIAGARLFDDLPYPLRPPIGARCRRDWPGRRFGAGGGAL